MSVKDNIYKIIEKNPKIKATKIASILGLNKKEVNSILYSKSGLRDKVVQNKSYEWSIASKSKPKTQSKEETEILEKNTNLTKLSKYFLDCLVYDADYGVSTFQKSNFKDLDYCQIPFLPNVAENSINEIFSDNQDVIDMLKRVKKNKSKSGLYIGYPSSLRFFKSKKGWEGFFVEPLFLFPLQFSNKDSKYPAIAQTNPFINFSFLKKYQLSDTGNIIEESIQIFEELGLNESQDEPDLDDVFQRLQVIRPEWNWKEEIDPHELSNKTNIADINEEGIYNKAVIINGDRSQFTQGLENELSKLTKVEENKYSSTSLGYIINNGEQDENEPTNQVDNDLIEVLPLNLEQRNAVLSSLKNRLTIITGPPGTGKSQVVTSILINAAWKGKKVLFASKNNKAVDVVEERINGIGSRPILLRHGRSEYQAKLAAYLTEMLSSKANESDEIEYKEAVDIHNRLNKKRDQINSELKELINLRNHVDKLEQAVENLRIEFGDDTFNTFKNNSSQDFLNRLNKKFSNFKKNIEQCIRPDGFIAKFFYNNKKNLYFSELSNSTKDLASEFFSPLKIKFDEEIPNEQNLSKWQNLKEIIEQKISSISKIKSYFENLIKLMQLKKPEILSKELNKIIEDVSNNSELLWRSWLKLQTNKLNKENRKLVSDYCTVLNLITNSDETGDRIDRKIWSKYYSLFPKVANLLPCWAVTSLSAGKIPFDANFFDILVIDEASQCDIASALPLMYRAKNLVVIGDPKQLKHITTLRNKQDQLLMHRHDIFDDFIQWSYSQNSFFDLPKGYCKGDDIVNLRDHHRSHSHIISFSNKFFYQESLRVATKYENLKNLPDNAAVRWINCYGETFRPSSGGSVNNIEAEEVINYLNDLVFVKNYKGSIGIVSPFRLQANKIRELVFKNDKLTSALNNLKFVCDTVHRFQGDERDLIIFSPVISKNVSRGSLGFLKSNGNLFNVAITRARSALIVIGDLKSCIESGIDYLSAFAKYTENIKDKEVKKEEELKQDYGIDYPNVSNPEQVSDWERLFYKALYAKGIKTIPQYNIDQYILDFAIIKGEKKLNIEIDGEKYHRDWTGELSRKDQIRNQRMFELGWDVIRFWVYEVRDNLDESVEKVKRWIESN